MIKNYEQFKIWCSTRIEFLNEYDHQLSKGDYLSAQALMEQIDFYCSEIADYCASHKIKIKDAFSNNLKFYDEVFYV